MPRPVLPPGAAGLKFWGTPNRPAAYSDAWSSGDRSVGISLSDNNRTATNTFSTRGVRSVARHLNGPGGDGKFYVEILVNSTVANDVIGLKAEVVTLTATGESVSCTLSSGSLFRNSTSIGSLGGGVLAGDTLCIAFDPVAERVWFRKNSGNWNNSIANNPATGVGGHDISVLTNVPFHVWFNAGTIGASVTLRTRVEDFVYGLPDGFSAWWREAEQPSIDVTGELTQTQGDDALSAAGEITGGEIAVVGTLDLTEASDTLSAAGTVVVGGTLTATQAAQSLVASGEVTVSGTLVVTQAAQTLSAQAGVDITGTLAVSEADDTLTATAAIDATAALVLAQAAQALAAAATVADVLGVTADSTLWTSDSTCVTADGRIICIDADVAEPVGGHGPTADTTLYTADNAILTADGGAVAGASDTLDAVVEIIGGAVIPVDVVEAAVALDQLDAAVIAAIEAAPGGVHYPRRRPLPVYGVGYGILPQLEGEAHGVVGAVGKSAAQLLVRASAVGACGQAGNAAVVLKGLAVVSHGVIGARGAGDGTIMKFSGSATGHHDDDEAAVIAFLLAA